MTFEPHERRFITECDVVRSNRACLALLSPSAWNAGWHLTITHQSIQCCCETLCSVLASTPVSFYGPAVPFKIFAGKITTCTPGTDWSRDWVTIL